jgi:hypothetical protein
MQAMEYTAADQFESKSGITIKVTFKSLKLANQEKGDGKRAYRY